MVVAGTILWGLGFVWAFIDPHPHRTAAEWLSPMIETGQVVAYEHWDETLDLTPTDGPVERIDLPSYDLRDDSDKIAPMVSPTCARRLGRPDIPPGSADRSRQPGTVPAHRPALPVAAGR